MAILPVKGGSVGSIRLRAKISRPKTSPANPLRELESPRSDRAAIKLRAAMLRWADKCAGEAYRYLKLDALSACMIAGRPRNSTERIQKENERILATPFLLWHFSPGNKVENCSAQFLAVCRIVRVEFKVHVERNFSPPKARKFDPYDSRCPTHCCRVLL